MDQVKEREVRVPVVPVGVKYLCDFCNEGYMEVVNETMIVEVINTDPPQYNKPLLRTHKCTKCGRTMQLPGVYPRIDWEEGEYATRSDTIPVGHEECTS